MKVLATTVIGLLLLIATHESVAQKVTYIEEADVLFRRALDKYNHSYYEDAISMFDGLLQDFPVNQKTTAASIMRAKALLRNGNLVEADRALKLFLTQFPNSMYRPDANYSLGLIYVKIQRYQEAASQFLAAWEEARTLRISIRVEDHFQEALERTIETHLDDAELANLRTRSTSDDSGALLTLKEAEKFLSEGNLSAAGRALDTLKLRYAGHRFVDREAALSIRVVDRSHVVLGVLLPLLKNHPPSALKEIGEEVFRGVQFALDDYLQSSDTKVKVSIDVRDTEKDPVIGAQQARSLIENPDVIGILGPVFSNVATSTVGMVNIYDVPLLTPTANTNGLAATGRYIFQANPDYENRGRASAVNAVRNLGLKNFAVVAPEEGVGKMMAEGFLREILLLGGEIIGTQWYTRGTTDLKNQLSTLRRAGMMHSAAPIISFEGRLNQGDIAKLIQLGVPRARLDSMIAHQVVVNGKDLLGPNAKELIDSLEITAKYDDPRIDSLIYPVTSVDAVYAPINSSGEIGVLSSQLVYFNFQTQILGSGEWENLVELDANKRYCKNVIFESDYYVNEQSTAYTRFYNQFLEQYKKPPGKNSLYGYDSARLLLTLIHNGATTRQALQNALSSVDNVPGLHSRIGLAERRVNSWLHIMQYNGETIQHMAEVNVNLPVQKDEVDGTKQF
ncbi:MAG TPA: ABC transporter substrate-binding protein [Bacteroidota bacterium]